MSTSGDFDSGACRRQPAASSSLHHPSDSFRGAGAILQDEPVECLLPSPKTRNLHNHNHEDTRTQKLPLHKHKQSVENSIDLPAQPLNSQETTAVNNKNNRAAKQPGGQQPPPPTLITAKELNSCIIASESTRAVCSILVAILVLISYIGYPPLLGINSVISKSVVAAKPLYMILLTDISVVFAHVVMRKRISNSVLEVEDSDGGGKGLSGEGLNWARAVMVLERGLVLHQTIRALFIDCSVYIIVVGCGLSLI